MQSRLISMVNAVIVFSDALHVIERFTPTGPDMIAYQLTYDDPKIFTKPWTTNWQMKRHPTWKLFEQECERITGAKAESARFLRLRNRRATLKC